MPLNFELVRLIADIRAFSETKVIKFLMNNSYRALSVGIIASMGFAVELKDPHFDTSNILDEFFASYGLDTAKASASGAYK